MNEKELLGKIALLKTVKPRQDWVVLTKSRIFGTSPAETFDAGQTTLRTGSLFDVFSFVRYLQKPAFAFAVFAFLILVGAGVYVANKPAPLVQQETEKPNISFSLELAQTKLREVREVAELNNREKLAAAVQEYKKSAAKVNETFAQLVEKDPGRALQASLEGLQLQKDKKELEEVLGMSIGTANEEFVLSAKVLIEQELQELESRSLTEEQKALFDEAKAAFEAGDYETALERIWQLTNNQ